MQTYVAAVILYEIQQSPPAALVLLQKYSAQGSCFTWFIDEQIYCNPSKQQMLCQVLQRESCISS